MDMVWDQFWYVLSKNGIDFLLISADFDLIAVAEVNVRNCYSNKYKRNTHTHTCAHNFAFIAKMTKRSSTANTTDIDRKIVSKIAWLDSCFGLTKLDEKLKQNESQSNLAAAPYMSLLSITYTQSDRHSVIHAM